MGEEGCENSPELVTGQCASLPPALSLQICRSLSLLWTGAATTVTVQCAYHPSSDFAESETGS